MYTTPHRNATRAADPDAVPEGLPITRRMHERITTDDGLNPSGRTMRAVMAAIQELEAAQAAGR